MLYLIQSYFLLKYESEIILERIKQRRLEPDLLENVIKKPMIEIKLNKLYTYPPKT